MKRHILYNLLLLALLCPAALIAGDFVIINQVMYDTPKDENAGQDESYNGEFFELYNGGSNDVSLNGWSIHSVSGTNNREVYKLPNRTIPAGGYLIFASNQGKPKTNGKQKIKFLLSDVYESLKTQEHPAIVYYKGIVLANTKDTLILFNPQNDTIDMVAFGKNTNHKAKNKDSIPGDDCVSLHRSCVELDDAGKVIFAKSQWKTAKVSFGVNQLPNPTFGTQTIVSFKPSTGSTTTMNGYNYVLAISPLDAMSTVKMSNEGITIDAGRTRTTIQYIDGLGRTEQTIALGASPTGKDLVSVVEYPNTGNVSRQWLPIEVQTDGQRIDFATIKEQAIADFGDDYPYAETRCNKATRTIEQTRPGKEYTIHPKKEIHGFNAADEVRMYTVKDTFLHYEGLSYAAATLHKTTIMDEDEKSVVTYTDKAGRKIMEKHGNGETYYVYDNLGRLRFMLPNVGSNLSIARDYPLSDRTLKAIAYCYKYDERGNMIYKRLPGCEPQYMVYDMMGQLILKQDGNQRKKSKWTQFAYDSIGRNLYTCEIYTTYDEYDLKKIYADKWAVEHFDGKTNQFPITNTGYANTILDVIGRMLTINYYDNYEFLEMKKLSGAKNDLLYDNQASGYGKRSDNTYGRLTGTRVYNLSESGFAITAYYYDAQGRVIQSRSVRGDGEGNFEPDRTTYTAYNFDGSIAKQLTKQGIEPDKVTEQYHYTYDHSGRAQKVYYKLNDDPEITLSEFSYDKTGHLAQNLLHNRKDTIAYSYDMRSMLTMINNKHFDEHLCYADVISGCNTPCYNGNISATHAGRKTSVTCYTYDECDRVSSMYRVRTMVRKGVPKRTNLEEFEYDDAGNIEELKRYNPDNGDLIDDLIYSYDEVGNQLLAITDIGEDADDPNIVEYSKQPRKDEVYMRYDANGNMTRDRGRHISRIEYNILNLPAVIHFVNGQQIMNMYDAAGRKYKSITFPNTLQGGAGQGDDIVFNPSSLDSVDYNIIEYNGSIEKHIDKEGDEKIISQIIHNPIGYRKDGVYYHYVKDHLGSICAVVESETGEKVQGVTYYASGVPMYQSGNLDEQSYLYNGKEFVRGAEYNVYDLGFREYYAAIGRFTTMDPLAEMTPWKSPYSYAGNNFVNKIDYMGLFEDYPTNPDGSPCYDCPSPSEFVHNNDYEWKAFNKDGSLNEDWWYENGYLDGGGYNWGGADFSSLGFNPYDINLSFIMLGEKTLLPGMDVLNGITVSSLFGPGIQVLNWIAVDKDGKIVDLDLSSPDIGVYEVDGNWDGTYWGLLDYKVVGSQLDYYAKEYYIGNNINGKYNTSGGGYYNNVWGCKVKYGTIPKQDMSLFKKMFWNDEYVRNEVGKSLITDVALGVADYYLQKICKDNVVSPTKGLIQQGGMTKKVETWYGYYTKLLNDGVTPQVAYDMTKEFLTASAIAAAPYVAAGIVKAAPYIAEAAPYILTAAALVGAGWLSYKGAKYIMNATWDLECTLRSPEFWSFYYKP